LLMITSIFDEAVVVVALRVATFWSDDEDAAVRFEKTQFVTFIV
jgi:hypothetical protein